MCLWLAADPLFEPTMWQTSIVAILYPHVNFLAPTSNIKSRGRKSDETTANRLRVLPISKGQRNLSPEGNERIEGAGMGD